MEYESDILKRLINTYGVIGNPRYISEIIKEFIVQGKECFPELFTYQSDWLAHIDELGLNPTYTVSYTGQSIYAPNTLERPVKSAILKGSTKYRDIDTGEFLETFEEDRNLELVSVKMPVLMTTGKNLNSANNEDVKPYAFNDNGSIATSGGDVHCEKFIKVPPSSKIFLSFGQNRYIKVLGYDENKNLTRKIIRTDKSFSFQTNADEQYIRLSWNPQDTSDITKLSLSLSDYEYKPYKSNILTVNEDVALRSNGNICDELNLLTGQLTQRIDEDGEVLSQEVVKTVELTILDQNGQNVKQLMSFNGGTHFNTGSLEGSPLPSVVVTVETDLEETLKICSLEGNTM